MQVEGGRNKTVEGEQLLECVDCELGLHCKVGPSGPRVLELCI